MNSCSWRPRNDHRATNQANKCALVPSVPDGPQWVYEIKLDSYRAIAVKSRNKLVFSRRRKSFNGQFAYVAEALGDLPEGTVIDGEIVALDESGRPNFNMLQSFRGQASQLAVDALAKLPVKAREVLGADAIIERATFLLRGDLEVPEEKQHED